MGNVLKYFRRLNSTRGFAPIFIVIAVALLAIPITTLLVQKQQDLRQRADEGDVVTLYPSAGGESVPESNAYYKCASDESKYQLYRKYHNSSGFTKADINDKYSGNGKPYDDISGSCPDGTVCRGLGGGGIACGKPINPCGKFGTEYSCTPVAECRPPNISKVEIGLCGIGETCCDKSNNTSDAPTTAPVEKKPTTIFGFVTINGLSGTTANLSIAIDVTSSDGKKYYFAAYKPSITGNSINYEDTDDETPLSINGTTGTYDYIATLTTSSGTQIGQGRGGGNIIFGRTNTVNFSVDVAPDSTTPIPDPSKPVTSISPPTSGAATAPPGGDIVPDRAHCGGNKYVKDGSTARCGGENEKYDMAKAKTKKIDGTYYYCGKEYTDVYECTDGTKESVAYESFKGAANNNNPCNKDPWCPKEAATPGSGTPAAGGGTPTPGSTGTGKENDHCPHGNSDCASQYKCNKNPGDATSYCIYKNPSEPGAYCAAANTLHCETVDLVKGETCKTGSEAGLSQGDRNSCVKAGKGNICCSDGKNPPPSACTYPCPGGNDGECGGDLVCYNYCCSTGYPPGYVKKVGYGLTCGGILVCEDWLSCQPTSSNPSISTCVPNGSPFPTPTINMTGGKVDKCGNPDKLDLGCACSAGSCGGLSPYACVISAESSKPGSGCCQAANMRWCPDTGECKGYDFKCGSNPASTIPPTATPVPALGNCSATIFGNKDNCTTWCRKPGPLPNGGGREATSYCDDTCSKCLP